MAINSSSPQNTVETHTFLPENWKQAAEVIAYDSITSPPPICVICGPPNTGKSTFSRHLLNVLVQRYRRVAYLDTDVGQPEFTPPGCLSLTVINEVTNDLAVPCLRRPERSFFFGDTTPRSNPNRYQAYIHALYDYYNEKYQQTDVKIGVPLVVNTPAWVEGTGFEILVEMLKHIAPTQVVKICAESKNLPHGLFWLEEGAAHEEVTILEIDSDCHNAVKKQVQAHNEARFLRDLCVLAYFRTCFPTKMSLTTIEELDHAMAVLPPYEVLISSVTIKPLYPEDTRMETIYGSNSVIVGLAVSSSKSEDLPRCVGLGIARGVDTTGKSLYLITPVPKDILGDVDLLLHGLIKIPACLPQVKRVYAHFCVVKILINCLIHRLSTYFEKKFK